MQPILLDLGWITIQSMWFFIALASFIGLFIFGKLAQKNRLKLQFLIDISGRVILGALLFGRLTAILYDYQFYFSDFGFIKLLNLFKIWDLEISFWGAILGAMLVFAKNASKLKENTKKWADIFAISLSFALAIGNIGTLLGGFNYGDLTNLPWGVTFDSPFVKYTVPIHPTQIYAFIYCTIIGFWLIRLHKKYKGQFDGLIFTLGLTAFSFFRFLEGFFRGDDVLIILNYFRAPQWTFLLIALFGLAKIQRLKRKQNIPLFKI